MAFKENQNGSRLVKQPKIGNQPKISQRLSFGFLFAGLLSIGTVSTAVGQEYLNGIEWKQPPLVTPGKGQRIGR